MVEHGYGACYTILPNRLVILCSSHVTCLPYSLLIKAGSISACLCTGSDVRLQLGNHVHIPMLMPIVED